MFGRDVESAAYGLESRYGPFHGEQTQKASGVSPERTRQEEEPDATGLDARPRQPEHPMEGAMNIAQFGDVTALARSPGDGRTVTPSVEPLRARAETAAPSIA